MEEPTGVIDAVADEADAVKTIPDTEEVEQASEEDREPTEQKEASEDADEEGEDGEEEAVEMREFDFGGNKIEVPVSDITPELADKIDEFSKGIWSDYTRKSQAHAEREKTLSEQEQAVAKISALNGETLEKYSQGLQLRAEIEQLKAVDLNALWEADPDQGRRVSDALAQKLADFQSIVNEVDQQEKATRAAQQAELARRAEEGRALLDRQIKNFSTEKAPELVSYVVKEFGISQADADQWALNPPVARMAYESMLYRRMQAKAKTPTAAPAKSKPVKAMKNKGGASGRSADPDKWSTAELRKELGLAS